MSLDWLRLLPRHRASSGRHRHRTGAAAAPAAGADPHRQLRHRGLLRPRHTTPSACSTCAGRLALRRPLAVPRLCCRRHRHRRSRGPGGRLAHLRPRHRRGPAGDAGLRHHVLQILATTETDLDRRGARPGRTRASPSTSAPSSRTSSLAGDRCRWSWRSSCSTPGRSTGSPYGRLLIATGGNEALARSLGKSTYRTKLLLFAVTSGGDGTARARCTGDGAASLHVGRTSASTSPWP